MKKIIKIGILVGSMTPLASTISCGNATINNTGQYFKQELNQPISAFETIDDGGTTVKVLNPTAYNKAQNIAENLYKNSGHVIVTLIANNDIYLQIVPYSKNKKFVDIVKGLKNIKIKLHNFHGTLGYWMQSFQIENKDGSITSPKHGTSNKKVENDYYPLFVVDHKATTIGISNINVQKNDFYEISYDF